ncbi:M16 family metallopeptidase [Devosia sediminis]|uniref:Insulinase family protein n=1 Tax=Devosia sediminis TaxID=2798801 RepID=A0A934IVE8_9HYPH|nr:pitrilysin family protein [Devosia sediminis]MBJ3783715.1 insulinase family protein [Devosia sediminis]
MTRSLPALFATVLLALPAAAQDQPAFEASHFTLDNGLELVVIPDRRAPIVTHMIWYRVGGADDPAGQSGVAHFLEHLMFKGTEKYPGGTLDRMVSELGGSTNAFTNADVTAYFQTIPPDALDEMMDIEADRMRNLVLPAEVIDAERDVVLDERRQRIDAQPQSILAEEINATLFQNHPYRIPVIGWAHEIADLSREDALDFYDRYYAPNNALVVVTGDVEPETVRDLAGETYGLVPRGPNLPERERASEPPHDTSRTVTYADDRVTLPSFSRNWVVPSYRTAPDGDAEALDLLSAVLSDGIRSRLYQKLVVETGMAANAGASYDGSAYDYGTFALYGTPRPGTTLEALEAAVFAEIDDIIANGIAEAELERVKRRYIRSTIFARDDQGNMAQTYGVWLTTGRTVDDVAAWPDRIGAVTADQVQAVAEEYLRPEIAVTGYLLPEAEETQK